MNQNYLRGFSEGAVAMIHGVEEKVSASGKSFKVLKASISEKKGDSYEYTWNGFINYNGGLKPEWLNGKRVVLLGTSVTNTYNKEKNVTYTNYYVSNLVPVASKNDSAVTAAQPTQSAPAQAPAQPASAPDYGAPSMPWDEE